MALNDLTSGFNTAADVSLKKSLAGLCGFCEKDLREILAPVAAERRLSPGEVERLLDVMRAWYNGYRFNEQVVDPVYNPTNVLYFLKELYLEGELPRTLRRLVYNPTNALYFLEHLQRWGLPPRRPLGAFRRDGPAALLRRRRGGSRTAPGQRSVPGWTGFLIRNHVGRLPQSAVSSRIARTWVAQE